MKKKSIRGFSLMELLAVMAIMGILATVAVTGYFSAVRGMARRRAVSNLVATLQQARQRACIDGVRTAVVCYNIKNDASSSELKTVTPAYVICKALGRITFNDSGKIGDEFTPLNKIFGATSTNSSSISQNSFGSRRIYNISRTGWTDVENTVQEGAYADDLMSGITGENFQPSPKLLWCFIKSSGGSDTAGWQLGDLYGIESSPVAMMPKMVYFGDLGATSTKQINVQFKPDGSATPVSISIIAQDSKEIANIMVESSGNIKGGDKIDLN
jgi:prepilin-type N-terminal cleavage/methylation domain-containing protein